MKILNFFLISLFLCTIAAAEGTHTWTQTTYEDFSHGTAKSVAIRSNGSLVMAPSFKPVFTSPSTYIWSIAAEKDGTVYIGTGSPARVYRVTPNGKATVIFEPKELQVQSLALQDGAIYAATSPDGKIYRIEHAKVSSGDKKSSTTEAAKSTDTENAKTANQTDAATSIPVDSSFTSSVFFDPKTKYIWDIAFDSSGNGTLFVATGDRGEIFKVTKTGDSAIFFKSDEAHIRTLAFDTKGNLIAGSDGSGLVYRISPSGEGFVVYSAPKKEITALAVDPAGNIYAAGIGEKRSGGPAAPIAPATPTSPGSTPGGQPASPPPSFNLLSASGGSEIYMISADGSPRRLFNSKDDLVYALASDSHGALLAGSGNRGRIISVDKNGDYVDLVRTSANQVTAFAPAPNKGLYVASSNLGKVFLLGATPDAEGTFESEVFDARTFSRWGRAEVRGTGDFELFARSGNVDNPDRNWSPWRKVNLTDDERLDAPAARFVQWKLLLKPNGKSNPGPRVDSVTLNYRPKNVAPVIEDITVLTGARVNPTQPRSASGNETVMIGLGQPSANPQNTAQTRSENPMTAQKDRGSITARWSARDENDDDLVYSIYYKGDGESRWKLLKDNVTDRFYSWDAALFPDGGYTLKVVASDAPSHSPDEALSDSRESSRFEVDTTPPRIEGLSGKIDASELHVSFSATDSFSNIQRAEFSVDAGEWQYVEPVGQISDSRVETYDFNVPVRLTAATSPSGKKKKNVSSDTPETAPDEAQSVPVSSEHVVVVRVYDRFENMGTAKVVVK